VFGKTVQLNLVDLGDTGFTLGDQIAFADDLLTNVRGKPGSGRFRNAHGESTLEFVRPGELNITLAIRG
jgi:hypothetical protein